MYRIFKSIDNLILAYNNIWYVFHNIIKEVKMPPKKGSGGGAKGSTKGKGDEESKAGNKEKKGGTAVKVRVFIQFFFS